MGENTVIRVLHSELSDSMGGIEVFLLNMLKHIDREKIKFDFVTVHKDADYLQQFKDLGADVHILPNYKTKPLQYVGTLKKCLQSKPYNIFHVHKNSAANLLPFVAAKRARTERVIAHAHSTTCNGGKATKVLHLINRSWLPHYITDSFACSGLAAEWLYGSRFVKSNQIVYLANGVECVRFAFDIERRRKLRGELGLDNQLVLGTVARLSSVKNQSFLLEIMAQLLKKLDAKLLLLGEGPEKERLQSQAKVMGLEKNVVFLGRRTNVEDFLNCMDVFLLPSFNEGLPLSAVEAQYNGLPCLISDTVTKECDISGHVKFLSIDNGVELWVHAIEDLSMQQRTGATEISSASFDIEQAVELMAEHYRTQTSKI